jgi:S1-C subfamily serine protease
MKTIYQIIALGFFFGIFGGIFADQILWPYLVERPLFYKYGLEQAPVYVNETQQITVQENVALTQAVEKAQKAVVGVRTRLASGVILEGSGLILTSDGLLVTLSELVPGTQTTFFWQDKQYKIGEKAKVLKRDSKNNLVLIKIEETNLPTISFADFGRTKIGERVFLAAVIFENGAPNNAANEGIVKTFDQDAIVTNMFEKYTLAGSPLFDIEGNVLGLNTIDQQSKVVAIPAPKIKTFSGF